MLLPLYLYQYKRLPPKYTGGGGGVFDTEDVPDSQSIQAWAIFGCSIIGWLS
jgi:hypothetical protein